jgi:hypothetical protein
LAIGVVVVVVVVVTSALAAASGASADPADTAPVGGRYVPIGPLRLADTREPACGCAVVDPRTITIDVAGRDDVPDEVIAVAVTVTATPTASEGFVTAYPGGTQLPNASTLNTRRDRAVANSTIVPVGADGHLEVFRIVPGDVVVDLTGVFVPATTARGGRFVPEPPRRVLDTRLAGGPLPDLGEITVPLPTGVPTDATAVAVNVTALGESGPSFLSVRPAGAPPSTTSFLNPNGSGQAVAAATIVPVSPAGFTVFALRGGHVVVDLLGWFTGDSAESSGDGLYVPTGPRRLLDTRSAPPRIWPGGGLEIASPVPGAAALVTNVTVTRADRRGFVTAYPAGTTRPETSTLNPAMFEHTLANLAITPLGTRGVAYWSLGGVDLIVDLTGWFTGTPVPSVLPPPTNSPPRSRVLLVGDSTLAGMEVYRGSHATLLGFDGIVDAASCRRLVRPSCRSNTTGLIPNTAVEAILGTPGRLDVVVVKAGYNDWFSDFPSEFAAVVDAARAKGAHTILWMTYNEDVRRENARRAYRENNADLAWLVPLPRYDDVVLADWLSYSRPRPDWFHDGTHTTEAGSYAIGDYVARWIAALEHRPCPRPWVLGQPAPDPCPAPETIGPVPDTVSLYR